MEKAVKEIDLISRARSGCAESMDRLACRTRIKLEEYVFRMSLDENLTQDVVQETLLVMVKVLGKLDKTDRFWPWIRRIAHNKLCDSYTEQRKRNQAHLQMQNDNQTDNYDGLTDQITKELRQIVISSMRCLKPAHRRILTMRCYEEMTYKDIAEVMDKSEFGVRMLFWRAKNALEKQLAKNGFKKGALLTALVIFGRLTARSEASMTHTAVAAGSLKVGVAVASVATLTTKTALTAAAGVALAIGATVATVNSAKSNGSDPGAANVKTAISYNGPANKAAESPERWFYYPNGPAGAVMVRDSCVVGGRRYCRRLQNQKYNFSYDIAKNTVFMTNYRDFNADLSVMRLPGDSVELTGFLDRLEGRSAGMSVIRAGGAGLFVMLKTTPAGTQTEYAGNINSNVIRRESFQFPWPADARRVDLRDDAHKRGWTYFTIDGTVNGRKVAARGQAPLVLGEYRQTPPWITVRIDGIELSQLQSDLFNGLGRPWKGLHTIDSVRRSAAAGNIEFATDYVAGDRTRAQIKLFAPGGTACYTINLYKDVIEKITFENPAGAQTGALQFQYPLQLKRPANNRRQTMPDQPNNGNSWLLKLID